ncbi:hypothetical protein RvY_01528-2 [Ramazzottius varieornatus]|uniref:14-3-3 domain-containing protein n=1 Tax=Ramazzottius varieornatus TaxID=947166 RepID=A0A1D1UGM9_RAMVA|nr:hypothetical protein RvY_01528-2 [Ramazzottius varieornatus]
MLQSVRAAIEASFQQAQSSQNAPPVSNAPANFARASLNLEINPMLLGSTRAQTREDYIFLADCSFRAHRHEELLAHVRAFLTVMEQRRDLVKDERYFIAVAYKDTIRGIRDAWRKVKKTEVGEKDAFKLRVSCKYRGELEDKMRMVCTEGLKVSSGLLTNAAVSPETRLYFCKV